MSDVILLNTQECLPAVKECAPNQTAVLRNDESLSHREHKMCIIHQQKGRFFPAFKVNLQIKRQKQFTQSYAWFITSHLPLIKMIMHPISSNESNPH